MLRELWGYQMVWLQKYKKTYQKTSCFIQQVFNIHFIFFLGKAAELDFHNLTNKYRRERRKIMTSESSGSGTKAI